MLGLDYVHDDDNNNENIGALQELGLFGIWGCIVLSIAIVENWLGLCPEIKRKQGFILNADDPLMFQTALFLQLPMPAMRIYRGGIVTDLLFVCRSDPDRILFSLFCIS